MTSLPTAGPLSSSSGSESHTFLSLSRHHTWPETAWVQQGPALGRFPAGVTPGPCLSPGTSGPVPEGAQMEELRSSSAISHSRPCHSMLPAHLGEGRGQQLFRLCPGLPSSRCTNCDASRRHAWGRVTPGAQEGPARLEGCSKRSSTPGTAPSRFALCWHSPHGLSLPQEQSLTALWGAGGARSPQLGGDPVSAGLLGAGLLLCLEGGQVNRKGTAAGGQGRGRWQGSQTAFPEALLVCARIPQWHRGGAWASIWAWARDRV